MSSPLEEKIAEIRARYQPQLDELKSRGDQMQQDFNKPDNEEAAIGVDFDVTWSDQEFIFDFPVTTMRTQNSSFDVPEVFMERQRIVIGVPGVRMRTVVIGKRPEIDGFNIKFVDITIEIPEPYIEDKEIIFDLPSTRMVTKEISFDIPDVHMEKVRWVIGLPNFTARNVSAEVSKMDDESKKLSADAESVTVAMKSEIDAEVKSYTESIIGKAKGTNSVIDSYNIAIESLNNSITDLVGKGIDPIKAPQTDGSVRNIRKELADLIALRDAAVKATEAQVG